MIGLLGESKSIRISPLVCLEPSPLGTNIGAV
jgi:hypothetical protein